MESESFNVVGNGRHTTLSTYVRPYIRTYIRIPSTSRLRDASMWETSLSFVSSSYVIDIEAAFDLLASFVCVL